jgi:hypothetical protein
MLYLNFGIFDKNLIIEPLPNNIKYLVIKELN